METRSEVSTHAFPVSAFQPEPHLIGDAAKTKRETRVDAAAAAALRAKRFFKCNSKLMNQSRRGCGQTPTSCRAARSLATLQHLKIKEKAESLPSLLLVCRVKTTQQKFFPAETKTPVSPSDIRQQTCFFFSLFSFSLSLKSTVVYYGADKYSGFIEGDKTTRNAPIIELL